MSLSRWRMQSQQPQKENSPKLADDVDATLVVTTASRPTCSHATRTGCRTFVLTLGSQKGVKHKTKVQKRTINPMGPGLRMARENSDALL